MPLRSPISRARAAALLALATGLGASSLPIMKGVALAQQKLVPGVNTLFLSSLSVAIRFALSAALVFLWLAFQRTRPTRSEIWQGLGLGLFGGMGILWQMDGALHLPASVTAFLTQSYCVFVPLFLALQHHRPPTSSLLAGCILVLLGVGILADFHLDQLRLDRGQAETILASLFFAAQILWLGRARFRPNRVGPVSLVMFVGVAVVVLPVTLASSHGAAECRAVFSSKTVVELTLFLALACTLVPYLACVRLQPELAATHAALIYASEPIFTCFFTLFLPVWLSYHLHVNYSNETLNPRLLLGGGLILAANLLVLLKPSHPSPEG